MDEVTRFWSKVQKTDDCWTWTAGKFRSGYGCFSLNGKSVRAHRYAYEVTNGPVPDGLELDHLCRNRACVKPTHLEAVTRRTNALRGTSFSAVNAQVTTCPRGHPYDDVNTVYSTVGRLCRICRNEASRRRPGRPCPHCDKIIQKGGLAKHVRRMH